MQISSVTMSESQDSILACLVRGKILSTYFKSKKKKEQQESTFNWESAECEAGGAELLAAESPQWVWPTGPDGVNILAAAKVW